MSGKIVSVEGSISSGKSTLLEYLKARLDPAIFVFVDEEFELWNKITDEKGTPLFELFYQDPNKFAFAFQLIVLSSRHATIKQLKAQFPQKTIICERSVQSSRQVFAKMLHQQGAMGKLLCIHSLNCNLSFKVFNSIIFRQSQHGHLRNDLSLVN